MTGRAARPACTPRLHGTAASQVICQVDAVAPPPPQSRVPGMLFLPKPGGHPINPTGGAGQLPAAIHGAPHRRKPRAAHRPHARGGRGAPRLKSPGSSPLPGHRRRS